MESLAKLQKLNLDMESLIAEEIRVKNLQQKLQSSLLTISSDIEREKSITLDASLNEKRIFEEKNELLITEKQLIETETVSTQKVKRSRGSLKDLQDQLEKLINTIQGYIESDKK